MLDKHLVPRLKPVLRAIAVAVHRCSISADQLTVVGSLIGFGCVWALAISAWKSALVLLFLNRLLDGLDGELARLQSPTDAGGFLDITLDFIFYATFPLGFALADPASNALPAALLIASFVGTGSSFLAFSSLASKHAIAHPEFAYKGLYYLDGLAEGTETILCFALMCLLPQHFASIAAVFALLCVLTTVNRIVFGYLTLRSR